MPGPLRAAAELSLLGPWPQGGRLLGTWLCQQTAWSKLVGSLQGWQKPLGFPAGIFTETGAMQLYHGRKFKRGFLGVNCPLQQSCGCLSSGVFLSKLLLIATPKAEVPFRTLSMVNLLASSLMSSMVGR